MSLFAAIGDTESVGAALLSASFLEFPGEHPTKEKLTLWVDA